MAADWAAMWQDDAQVAAQGMRPGDPLLTSELRTSTFRNFAGLTVYKLSGQGHFVKAPSGESTQVQPGETLEQVLARLPASATALASQTLGLNLVVQRQEEGAQRAVQRFEYDRWGNLTRRTGATQVGAEERFQYNDFNQMVKQETLQTVSGANTRWVNVQQFYDVQGRSIGTQDERGNQNTQVLDAQGHVVAEHQADGTLNTHVYDGFGNRVMSTEGLTGPSGLAAGVKESNAPQVTLYRFDERNLLVGQARLSVTFTRPLERAYTIKSAQELWQGGRFPSGRPCGGRRSARVRVRPAGPARG
ncbi:MAG: hypothetical protein E6Q92_02435 [Burkholderiaceae bacterium]|nr:MAG: hypothetical protein E6Q92_02435 [Burkholderiaceae bacterium]